MSLPKNSQSTFPEHGGNGVIMSKLALLRKNLSVDIIAIVISFSQDARSFSSKWFVFTPSDCGCVKIDYKCPSRISG